MTQTTNLKFEDLQVGQIFRSETYVMETDKIKTFAREFDPQPFHTDETAAGNTFFGELVASGWHTAAVTMRLMVGSIPIAGGLVGAGAEISWSRPTKPGDQLHVESEIVELRPSTRNLGRGTALVRSTTKNQDGKTVQVITSKIVVPR